MDQNNKPKGWFWLVAIIAFIWNLFGVLAYIGSVTLSPEELEAMSEAEKTLRESTPSWAVAAFASATCLGFLGSLLLLLRKALAEKVLIASFLAVLVQMYFSFFVIDGVELMGNTALIMPIIIILFGIGLIVFARKCTQLGWLR